VNGSEGAAAGPLLGLRGAGSVGALGAREDAARGDDQDVAVGEFLLEFAGEAGGEGFMLVCLKERLRLEI
jgi:hypothetical protein